MWQSPLVTMQKNDVCFKLNFVIVLLLWILVVSQLTNCSEFNAIKNHVTKRLYSMGYKTVIHQNTCTVGITCILAIGFATDLN